VARAFQRVKFIKELFRFHALKRVPVRRAAQENLGLAS
jgi:hypothetical protein